MASISDDDFDDETFTMLHDRGGSTFESLTVTGCTFDSCGLSVAVDRVDRMSGVRDARLVDCTLMNCQLGPTVVQDVTIDGLKANQLVLVWSWFLRRVTLRGRITSLKLNAEPSPVATRETLERFDTARQAFYAETDWALDISQARFVNTFELSGVPLDLVRRDPASQAVLSRANLPDQETLSALRETYPQTCLLVDDFIGDHESDRLLVAPLAGRKARREDLLGGIAELRRRGFAD